MVSWCNWVSIGRYWLVLGGIGSEQGGTGCQCDMLSENICGLQIIQYSEKDKVIKDKWTHKQTDRISYLRSLLYKGSSKNKILTVVRLHVKPA